MVKSTSGPSDNGTRHSSERRDSPERVPLQINAGDLDPVLGTLIWTRFAQLLADEQTRNNSGALLVVDLDTRSQALSTDLDENRDEVLSLLIGAIQRAIRQDDLVTHIHDCRFAVLLLDAPQDIAAAVATRILEAVDSTIFFVQQGIAPLSVAVGGAIFGQDASSKGDPFQFATDRLSLAQSSDRRVQIA